MSVLVRVGSLLSTSALARVYYTSPSLSLNFKDGQYYNSLGYSRTNYIPNSTMVGATASSLPTGWSFSATSVNGLNVAVVATGAENGRNYVDLAFTGTTTASATISTFFSTSIVAAAGQTWTQSVYARVVSGTSANVNYAAVQADTQTSGGTYVGTAYSSVLTLSSSMTRSLAASGTLVGGTVGKLIPYIFINYATGQTANLTLRIYQPQLEQAGSPSSDILTTTAAVTVTTYSSTNPADVGNLTYTRAGTAYASDSSGNLIAFADNVPRITNLGYLAEPSATNLALWSQQFTNAAWVSTGLTPSDNALVAPNGTLTAASVNITVSGAQNLHQGISVSPLTTYTFSFWAIRGTATDLRYSVYDIIGGANIIAPTSYYSQTNSVGWSRINATFTTPAGCTAVYVYPNRDATSTGTFGLWQADLVAGSIASSPILTTTAAVTRPADVGYYTLSSSLSTAYSLAAVGQSNAGSGATPILAQLDDGSDATRATIFLGVGSGTVGQGISFVAGANQFTLTPAYFSTNGTSVGVALAVQTSRAALSANGGTIVAASGGTIPTVSILRLGSFFSGANPLNGTLKWVAVYSSALPDAGVIYRGQGNLS